MRWKGPLSSTTPTARSLGTTEPAEHTNIASANLNEHRSTRCPSPQKAPFPGTARQVVDRCRPHNPLARSRRLEDPEFHWPRSFPRSPVTVSGGVGDFYRHHIPHARAWRTRFQVSSPIHRHSPVTPRPRHVIHRLSTGSSTHPTGTSHQAGDDVAMARFRNAKSSVDKQSIMRSPVMPGRSA
jgi:hypothetical protein